MFWGGGVLPCHGTRSGIGHEFSARQETEPLLNFLKEQEEYCGKQRLLWAARENSHNLKLCQSNLAQF